MSNLDRRAYADVINAEMWIGFLAICGFVVYKVSPYLPSSRKQPAQPAPTDDRVAVFDPPLARILADAKKQKGAPLTKARR